jgi:glycosyltransferase involved in cell wall biosynthesis
VRITHVITRLIVGGAQENTVASVLGLRQHSDLTVRLISGPTNGPEGSLEPSFANAPEVLTIVPQLVRPIRPWKDWRALAQLTYLLRTQRPDLVHTHSGKAGILGRLAARRAGVPIIVHTIHGPSFGAFQHGLAKRIFRAAERHAAGCTTHFVSVAEAMTEQYLAAGIGRPEQFTCIRSGFALARFLSVKSNPDFRARLGIASGDFVVGMIARLCELKGHDDLITASPAVVKRNPRVKFLLVGDGPWRDRLQARVRALALQDHFVFAGLVPPSEIPQYVGAMDVLAHLSRREGLARALPQALAAARPVIAYDCDGAKEICLPDKTGYLIPPGDLQQLTDRLLQLAGDPALRERLGKQGQQLVKERFSVERMVEELCELYRRLGRAPQMTNDQ